MNIAIRADFPDSLISAVRKIDTAILRQGQSIHPVNLRLYRRSTISAEAIFPVSGDRVDNAVCIDFPDSNIITIAEIYAPIRAYRNRVRVGQHCLGRGYFVSVISPFSCPGDQQKTAVRIDFKYPILIICEIHHATLVKSDIVRIDILRCTGRKSPFNNISYIEGSPFLPVTHGQHLMNGIILMVTIDAPPVHLLHRDNGMPDL